MLNQLPVFGKNNITELSNTIESYPDGFVILLNKPYQWTSADAVRKIKFLMQRVYHKKKIKIGHAGTLDPLATGLLVLCVGNATKKSEELQAGDKEYIANIQFGATTPSFDLEKEIDETYPYSHIKKEDVEKALKLFIGEQDQIPPKFSAKFVNGTRAYEIARSGEEIELRPSKITIYSIDILNFNNPNLTVDIKCGKGTYIRSFARDIGITLSSGAHLTGLIRAASGNFNLKEAIDLEELVKFLENK